MDALTVERLKAGMRYEAERTAPPAGFPQLPAIPAGRYSDPQFVALEQQHLWKQSWLYACHLDEIPAAGSYYLFSRTGSPIVVVRGQDGEVRAFYNTCRHRGAALVTERTGRTEGLACPYHGWTYALDGRLLNLRDKRDFVGLRLEQHSLAAVRCERFGNWVFVNQDPAAAPLLEHLRPIPEYLRQIQPDQVRFVDRRSYKAPCNFKLMLEAFLEVYHLKSIHPGTADRFLDHRGTSITLWPNGHSLMLTPNRRPDWQDPGTQGLRRIETATEIVTSNNPSFLFYPNLVTPVDATGNPFLLFWPTGPAEMEIEVAWFAPDWGGGPPAPAWEQRLGNFERILAEDIRFAGQIQQSVGSDGFRGSTLNYQERRIYHWHEELDRRIGPASIPAHLRVTPALDRFISAGPTPRP